VLSQPRINAPSITNITDEPYHVRWDSWDTFKAL
jgi:hypothetical protein